MKALLLCAVLLAALVPARAEERILQTLKPGHPRLLVTDATWRELREKRASDPVLDQYLSRLESDGRDLLSAPPLAYHKIGRRLLDVSRSAVSRILLWSVDYRVTGDAAFLRRAEEEMRAVCAFGDWNPSHFLDTAEMTTALALGYDWLYDVLSPETRAAVREAIIEKGLKPGAGPMAWKKATNNWNAVCFGGMALGALAVAEDAPELAERTLAGVRVGNPAGMTGYAPDGVYPEGPSYWDYGTTYQTILLSALESALGTDWGLSASPGFLQSAGALMQAIGPLGDAFNYSDSGIRAGSSPALFWYARRLSDPGLLAFHSAFVPKAAPRRPDKPEPRFLPLGAVWWAGAPGKPSQPLQWLGRGVNPMAAFRSAWNDPKAFYLACKGGSASLSHGHMDAGSFVLDADGVRWAHDLGMQAYESLESKGITLWDGSQEGRRWTVFRLNNFSHNTLTLNGQLHRAKGSASIVRFSGDPQTPGGRHAVVDLSQIFEGQARKVVRGFRVGTGNEVLIQDEIHGMKPGGTVRWAMMTSAEVELKGNSATLREKERQLQARIATPSGAAFAVVPADPPPNAYDAPNPNRRLLVVTVEVPASGDVVLRVLLRPGAEPPSGDAPGFQPAETWSAPLTP